MKYKKLSIFSPCTNFLRFLTFFEVPLRCTSADYIGNGSFVIENLQYLWSGIGYTIRNDFAALHVTLEEFYKITIWISSSKSQIYLNEIIHSIDINTLIVSFHTLQHRREFTVHLRFEVTLQHIYRAHEHWERQNVKIKFKITKSSICAVKWNIFHPFTVCETFAWLAKSMTDGRRSSRGFTSE